MVMVEIKRRKGDKERKEWERKGMELRDTYAFTSAGTR